ncbi:hypothetical protein ACXPWS_10525 [Mycobacterium sp. BMJ-28]
MRSTRADRVAWQLAEQLAERISAQDRAAMYCSLGCGDTFDALADIIQLVIDYHESVIPGVICELHGWLNGYRGNRDEPRVRAMIHAIPARCISTP